MPDLQGCGRLDHVHSRIGCTFLARKGSGWDQRLVVGSGGKGLVGHAGAVLLRKCADRTVKFTVGWTITDTDEAAIELLPAGAWSDSLNQDGTATNSAHVAELTGLNHRLHAWTGTLRLLVRRTKPSARHAKNLTDLEKPTGWRYGQVRCGKAMGLRKLPSKAWTANRDWVLACNIATDLAVWTRLVALHDQPDLAHAEPDTLRYRLLHLPANLAAHARRRVLSVPDTWPWAEAFTRCRQRLSLLPLPT